MSDSALAGPCFAHPIPLTDLALYTGVLYDAVLANCLPAVKWILSRAPRLLNYVYSDDEMPYFSPSSLPSLADAGPVDP